MPKGAAYVKEQGMSTRDEYPNYNAPKERLARTSQITGMRYAPRDKSTTYCEKEKEMMLPVYFEDRVRDMEHRMDSMQRFLDSHARQINELTQAGRANILRGMWTGIANMVSGEWRSRCGHVPVYREGVCGHRLLLPRRATCPRFRVWHDM